MRSPLIHCQHVGVGRAGEHQLPNREVPQSPQAVAFARTLECLRPLYTFVLHGFFRLRFFDQILPSAATTCVRSAVISFCLSRFFLSGSAASVWPGGGSRRPLLDRRQRSTTGPPETSHCFSVILIFCLLHMVLLWGMLAYECQYTSLFQMMSFRGVFPMMSCGC